jgi:N-acetylmuramoyl-L-alanine amidase
MLLDGNKMERLALLFIVSIFPFYSCASSQEIKNTVNQNVFTIIIDAGHGGKDYGAVVTHKIDDEVITLMEKDMSLNIAKALAAYLNEKLPQIEIVLTRTKDEYISKEERVTKYVNIKSSKVVFVSIHLNYSINKNMSGFEVYYYFPALLDPNAYITAQYLRDTIRNNSSLAKNILTAIGNIPELKDTSKNMRNNDYYVLKNAVVPSVLIECGFLSNESEALLLKNDSYNEKLVEGIALGIFNYLNSDDY